MACDNVQDGVSAKRLNCNEKPRNKFAAARDSVSMTNHDAVVADLPLVVTPPYGSFQDRPLVW